MNHRPCRGCGRTLAPGQRTNCPTCQLALGDPPARCANCAAQIPDGEGHADPLDRTVCNDCALFLCDY